MRIKQQAPEQSIGQEEIRKEIKKYFETIQMEIQHFRTSGMQQKQVLEESL